MSFRVRPWMLGSAVWIAPAVFATINQIAQRSLRGEPPASPRDLLWAAGDWLIYAVLAPVIFAVSNRWPIVRPHLARRTLLHLGFAVLASVAWATLGKVLQFGLALLFSAGDVRAQMAKTGNQLGHGIGVDVASWIFTTLPFGMIVYLCVAGLAHAIRYFVEVREREVQMARLSEQLAGARYTALQAQLNPHFLFNALNTIAVRARDGDGRGTALMVEQLSDMLRRTLTRHRANEVPLVEEITLVRQYLGIEQARFSDRLQPTFDVHDALLAAAVPSFAVQHLVENAIRHGITRRPGAGRVRVAARRVADQLELTVEDDGAGIDALASFPKGHGIDNTLERLRALYGDRASLAVTPLAGGGTVATLRVPYHELPREADVAVE